MLSEFTRMSAFVIILRRALVTDTLSQLGTAGLSDDPLPKLARDNTFSYGGKFLDQINETLSVQKTAAKIAS